jgi:DNA topoisomerase-3
MRLVIAEKPSLARAIADALPGPQRRRDGYVESGDDVVTWCAGHILELAPPDAYDPGFRTWDLKDLPIVPSEWTLVPTAPDLLKTIARLLPKAARVVHAGDPDREGQLLIDEVLAFLGYGGPVDRLLISDLNPPAVRKALGELRPNAQYRSLYHAALARQRADWLYGINLTRLYTLLGRAGGYDGVLSVGRVQTPLLGLIVRRDEEIERFRPTPYFVMQASLRTGLGAIRATWVPPAGATHLLDEDGRLISRDHAAALRSRLAGQAGRVLTCVTEPKHESPQLPYSLPALQVDAGQRLGLGPKHTLDACQALYETHRLLTYPRSDCSYLPEGQLSESTNVLAAVARNLAALAPLVLAADPRRRSRAWDDKKVSAHHAIVPTAVPRPDAPLSDVERAVYDLVARRFVAQFYPAFEFKETTVEIQVGDERFRARGRQMVAEGWRQLVKARRSPEGSPDRADEEDDLQPVPALREGATLACEDLTVIEKQTKPPKRFTEASLIQAMIGIARFVDDPRIKELLNETDGIGTPATQAQIIQTLFDRKFLEKRGKQIHATATGCALIRALPEVATRPDRTALWEAAMRRIVEGQVALPAFLATVIKELGQLITGGRALGRVQVPSAAGPEHRARARSSGARALPRKHGRRHRLASVDRRRS